MSGPSGRYSMVIECSEDDQAFIVTVPELPAAARTVSRMKTRFDRVRMLSIAGSMPSAPADARFPHRACMPAALVSPSVRFGPSDHSEFLQIRSKSSAVSRTSNAPSCSSTCSGDFAPTMAAVTPGWASVQAIAS
jgi:hypothetical protein